MCADRREFTSRKLPVLIFREADMSCRIRLEVLEKYCALIRVAKIIKEWGEWHSRKVGDIDDLLSNEPSHDFLG